MTDTNNIMTDTNNIFLYNIPKFKMNKVYPINQCDLCCDISVVETCPLPNCDYKMCGSCWNKIINDSNKCPVCRRELPIPHISCSDYTEKIFIKYIDNIKVIFISLFGIIVIYVLILICFIF